MNYYYFDQNNQKHGPFSEQQLKDLAVRGLINRQTPMETDTGHRGVAGQIHGLFPAQGTALPLKLAIGGIAVAVAVGLLWFVFSFFTSNGGGNEWRTAFRTAKAGDWAEYETTFSGFGVTERNKFKVEVLSNNGKVVKLRTTTTVTVPEFDGRRRQEVEKDLSVDSEIDLSKSFEEIIRSQIREGFHSGLHESLPADMPFGERIGVHAVQSVLDNFLDNLKFEFTEGRKTREKLSVAGQSSNCTVTPYTGSISLGNLTFTVRDVKVWRSKAAPIDGTVQTEFQTSIPGLTGRNETITITMRLAAFRKQ